MPARDTCGQVLRADASQTSAGSCAHICRIASDVTQETSCAPGKGGNGGRSQPLPGESVGQLTAAGPGF